MYSRCLEMYKVINTMCGKLQRRLHNEYEVRETSNIWEWGGGARALQTLAQALWRRGDYVSVNVLEKQKFNRVHQSR